MRVSFVSIKNILGVSEFELRPEKITMITGANGSGKTSILNAIKSVFERGGAKDLKKVDADSGEVVIEITDGETTHKVRRSITSKGDYTSVDGDAGGKGWLQELVDQARLNPVSFLTATPKQRLELLLRAVAVQFPREALLGVVKPLLDAATERDALNHSIAFAVKSAPDPFGQIEAVHDAVFSWRTGVNRSLKDARSSAEELRQALPADGSHTLETVEREIGIKRQALEKIESRNHDRLNEARRIRDEAVAKANAELERKTEEIRAASADLERTTNDDITRLNITRDDIIRTKRTREIYDGAVARADAAGKESEACTAALDSIAKIKTDLLETLPVEGMSIRDGEIYVGDVPFDRLNTQQQIEIAVKVAEMIPSKLDLCIIDGFEALDPERQKAFIERAGRSPLQFMIASVGPSGLRVTSAAA